MATIELDQEQADTLRRTLEVSLAGLRFEIAHTDQREFRAMLKHRAEVLESLVAAAARIAAPPP